MTVTTTPGKRFILVLLCGCAFVAAAGYLSTGTMAPYAATHPRPLILKPCNYLLNPDNPHFEATFKLLRGAPPEEWNFSVVLRRTLFPVLAYPLMRLWGFFVGGVVTSLVIQVAAFATFAIYVRRRVGFAAGTAAVVLLATYPGIYYWCGLPYSYAIIVPATLMATICAREIDLAPALPRACLFATSLGVLFTGYDLLAYFAPAVVMILLLRRRWPWIVPVALLMLAPGVLNNFLLVHVGGVDFRNENSRFYATILQAYFHPPAPLAWAKHVSPVFESLLKVFFFSNFAFLPALFLVAVAANLARGSRRVRMERVELWVLLTGLGLFLFINLAPPYRGWQFRGYGMARIYQPVFGVMLLFVARVIQGAANRRWLTPAVGVTAAVNASIALGPVLLNPLAAWAYSGFYRHAPEPEMVHNLRLFGRRPLGFCDASIALDNPPPRRHGAAAATKPSKARLEREGKLRPKKLTRAQRERLRQQHPSPASQKSKTTKKRPARKKPRATSPPASGPSAPSAAAAPSPGG